MLLLLVGCGVEKRNDNDYFEEAYSVSYSEDSIDFYKFSDFDSIFSKVKNGLVLFTRIDCQFCVDTFSQLSTLTKSDFPVDSIFVLQTENLTEEEKDEIFEIYRVDAVPTFIYIKDGEKVYSRIGVLNKDHMSGFIEDIKKILEDKK